MQTEPSFNPERGQPNPLDKALAHPFPEHATLRQLAQKNSGAPQARMEPRHATIHPPGLSFSHHVRQVESRHCVIVTDDSKEPFLGEHYMFGIASAFDDECVTCIQLNDWFEFVGKILIHRLGCSRSIEVAVIVTQNNASWDHPRVEEA